MNRDQHHQALPNSVGRREPGATGLSSARLDTAESLHALLRRVTADRHRAVEEAFSRFDISERRGLRGFLRAQAVAVVSLESELESRGVAQLLPDWPERRRTDAITADLARLDASLPAPVEVNLPTPGHVFGALYVLEGSRLGGQLLKRIVAASPDPLVRDAEHFLGHKAGPRGWPRFLEMLNGLRCDSDEVDQMTVGADRSFALFQFAASVELSTADERGEPRGGTLVPRRSA